MPDDRLSFKIENARLIFRNFSGRETMVKPEGYRNFSVVLEPQVAEDMASDGWNVKWPKPRPDMEEGEDTRDPIIEVAVGYSKKARPPRIVMITESNPGGVNVSEETVGLLDWVDIRTVDLIAVASPWEVGGKSGIKAYLKTMFITVEEDDLERKYAVNNMPGDING